MNELRAAVNDYITIRRALGFKLREASRLLLKFVDFLEQAGACTVTTELAMAWAKQPPDVQPNEWARGMSAVRCFARHLQTLDPRTEVPPPDLLSTSPSRATPYLYSEADITALMEAARALRSPLPAATFATFIGLLAVTGMRAGEALRLDRDDLDEANGLLTVRDSKFGKSREVPLHPSTVEALRAYAQLRDGLFPRPTTTSFFVSTMGTRLIYSVFHFTFLELVRQAGLQRRSATCRPRPHDLRHTFAVRTLLDWYRAGFDVEAQMPLLSTYLGHFKPRHTYWYLSATPELLALAGHRLERVRGDCR
jgi:integrase/recombinase XerD